MLFPTHGQAARNIQNVKNLERMRHAHLDNDTKPQAIYPVKNIQSIPEIG